MKLRGFTTIELLAVMGMMGLVISLFWYVFTINDKIWKDYKLQIFGLGDQLIFEKALFKDWREADRIDLVNDDVLRFESYQYQVEYTFADKEVTRNIQGQITSVYHQNVSLTNAVIESDLVVEIWFVSDAFKIPLIKQYDAATLIEHGH